VFPRSQKTGYFGDITRTVVKGRATEGVRRLFSTIERGQAIGFEQIKAGASGREIHKAIAKFFELEGYKTGKTNGRMQGFFHGTGHGVGLEIHEAPGMGPNSVQKLRAGNVVTVEPGLYYWDLGGGVRIEDTTLVTATGTKNLTKFEKVLEV
jgi:Xaa-Pro aminopeptidase